MSIPLTALGQAGFQIVNIENDGSCNPLFVGWARPGSADSDAAWLIIQVGYDAGSCIATIRFATFPGDLPETALSYEKVWDDRASYTYI